MNFWLNDYFENHFDWSNFHNFIFLSDLINFSWKYISPINIIYKVSFGVKDLFLKIILSWFLKLSHKDKILINFTKT